MYFSLIILVLFVSGSLTIDCPHSPSKWCETKEIAQACGVKFFSFLLFQFSPLFRLVNNVKLMSGKLVRPMIVSIYRFIMKTLCPDCRQFITTQVWNAYQSILDIVNITFVPYGNARELYRPETKLYQYYCQHGAEECYGNLIHVRNRLKKRDLDLFSIGLCD